MECRKMRFAGKPLRPLCQRHITQLTNSVLVGRAIYCDVIKGVIYLSCMPDTERDDHTRATPLQADANLNTAHGAIVPSGQLGQKKAIPDGALREPLVDGPGPPETVPQDLGPTMVALATSHLRSPHSKRAYRQAVMGFMTWCVCTGTTELAK